MSFYRYDEKGKQIIRKVGLDCQKAIENGERVLVEQNHKKSVDINYIVKQHAGNAELIAKTQQLTNFRYDNVDTNDFQEMMNQMLHAKETFANVPSGIRKQFDNNPAKFMDFCHNPENTDKLIELGLANKPEETIPIEVIVKNTEASPVSETGQ